MNSQNFNWDDIRIFLAIAEAGSLSGAARRLKLSQPTVGRHLQTLEKSLDTRLFDRLPDGFLLTEAGLELRHLAQRMADTAAELDRRREALANRLTGTVRISAGDQVATYLADRINVFRRELPDIELELSMTHISANLSRREADLLIRFCLPDSGELMARKLGNLAHAVYASADFLDRHPEAHSEECYNRCTWVSYDDEHRYQPGTAWLAAKRDNRLGELRVNNGRLLHDLVRSGQGLGVLPCITGDADPTLTRLTPPLEEMSPPMHLLVHRDLRNVPAIRAVMEQLVDIFRQDHAALSGAAA